MRQYPKCSGKASEGPGRRRRGACRARVWAYNFVHAMGAHQQTRAIRDRRSVHRDAREGTVAGSALRKPSRSDGGDGSARARPAPGSVPVRYTSLSSSSRAWRRHVRRPAARRDASMRPPLVSIARSSASCRATRIDFDFRLELEPTGGERVCADSRESGAIVPVLRCDDFTAAGKRSLRRASVSRRRGAAIVDKPAARVVEGHGFEGPSADAGATCDARAGAGQQG